MIKKIYQFYTQVKQEVCKVHWLEKKYIFSLVAIVVITIAVTSLICLAIDYIIHNLINFILTI